MSKKDTKKELPTVKLNAYGIFKEQHNTFESGLLAGPGKGDKLTEEGAVQSNALEFEDDFKGRYGPIEGSNDRVIIHPPFNPLLLEKLVKHNNTLGPSIEAMKVNIDGTGFEIIRKADTENKDESEKITEEEKKDLETLKDFFDEPWPGISFTKIRKDLRTDLETIGYGFLEVVRNPKGEIVFLRHVEAKTMRLLKLDKARTVTREINRRGIKRKTKVNLRFRRFVQKVGQKFIYFKEFQADIGLDKQTGLWAKKGETISFQKRGSELIYFVLDKDINTPYGVPRWIAQTPSILGSRRAEENNLDFFNSGGIPPFILIVQGGIIAQETKDALESGLSSNTLVKQRGLVIEAHSSSGSLDDKNSVKIQVERFGAEKQKDSQFEVYDDKSHLRVRGAFRLPPIFLGRSAEYNFASAFVSYMIGEAQIFKPERDEFDEIITLRLIPEIIGKDNNVFKFRSLPLVVNDAKEKIMAIKVAADKKAITKKELVRNLNEITTLEMIAAEGTDELPADTLDDDNEGITSDSSLTDASTADPNGPQGQNPTDTKKRNDFKNDED